MTQEKVFSCQYRKRPIIIMQSHYSIYLAHRRPQKKKTSLLLLNIEKQKVLNNHIQSILQTLTQLEKSFLLLFGPAYQQKNIPQMEQLLNQHDTNLRSCRLFIFTILDEIDKCSMNKSLLYQIMIRLVRRISIFKSKLETVALKPNFIDQWQSTLLDLQQSQSYAGKFQIRPLVENVFGNYYKYMNENVRKIIQQIRRLRQPLIYNQNQTSKKKLLTQMSEDFLKFYEQSLRKCFIPQQQIEEDYLRKIYIPTMGRQANVQFIYHQARKRNKVISKEMKSYEEEYKKHLKKHEKRLARSLSKDAKILKNILVLRTTSVEKSKFSEDSLPRLEEFKPIHIRTRKPSKILRIL